MRDLAKLLVSSFLLFGAAACAPPEVEDPIDEVGLSDGKADGETLSACEATAILRLVNDPATTVEALRSLGVASKASKNIVKRRDQSPIDTVAQLDAVGYVGRTVFGKLAAAVKPTCTQAGPSTEVIFSPHPWAESHLARLVGLINNAQESIDIAIYSFRDAQVQDALRRAVERNVDVRMIFETAGDDARNQNPAGTPSARLEEIGVDVRYVNRIMHHKFAIIDGPRRSADQARTAVLVTGSANWSGSAATTYDENTVFMRGQAEATLRMQREFNYLWANSRDFTLTTAAPASSSLAITDVADAPGLDIVYTSDNFLPRQTTTGPSFTLQRGKNTIADKLVQLIAGAQKSIHIASGHLRSSQVAEALLAKHAADPGVDIRIYLDGQEYLSEFAQQDQDAALEACVAAAGGDANKKDDCYESGLLFSLKMHRAGIPLRYKYYAYRWDASYAAQMHNKYFIIDGKQLASGSYNLSNNAEHQTMENMVIFDGAENQGMIASFEASFAGLWETGRAEDRLAALKSKIGSGQTFPIVFDPMALDWNQVSDLKTAIRAACPNVDSTEYRSNATAHRVCQK